MTDAFFQDSLASFQLKECYELAAQYETFDPAKEILRERSKKLDFQLNYSPVQTDVPFPETEMQIVSESIYGLTLEGFIASEDSTFRYAHKVDSLPGSGEKEFVLALFSLRKGTNEAQRADAMRHITIALSYSRDDPRYIALANILQQAGNK